MNWASTILKIILAFFGWQEKKEENFDAHELKDLDEKAIQLQKDIMDALDAGNPDILRERQDAYDLNRARAAALRSA